MPQERQAWTAAFEFLQMLRLQLQLGEPLAEGSNPKLIDVGSRNDIDRRMLKETMRIARNVQQRITLNHQR